MTSAQDRTVINAIKADRAQLRTALLDAGGRFAGDKVACPFHDDSHPSGSIHQAGDDWLYTCHSCGWNGGKGTGDVIAVVRATHDCDFLAALDRLGVNGDGRHGGNGAARKTKPSATDIAAAQKLATDSAARLMSDSNARDRLWQTRGIDRATAEKLGLGVTGEMGKRFITMSITDAGGKFIAVKAHRLDGQSRKSWWQPKGVDRNQLFPVYLDGPGPVWPCPGELKAAALIGVGLPAIGITSGEGTEKKITPIPDRVSELLQSGGKAAALPPDDDATGKRWGELNRKVLDDAGIDARIVDLGLDKAVGLKDIGDFVVRELVENARESDGVRETLLHAYRLSDPWGPFTLVGIMASPQTWRPVTYVKTGFSRWDELAGGGLRTRGVHLVCGKPGVGKSTLAIQVASNTALAGVPVGIISLEMTREDLAKLVVAQNTAIPRRVLDSGQFDDGYIQTFDDFKSESAKMPLTILDDDYWQGPLDREGLAKLIAEGKKRFGWKLVVVDYLGLVAPGENDQGNFDTELRNSSALKRMASKFDIALLVVAALRKSANFQPKGPSNKISLDDLSGAGRLAYDATTVWYVASEQQHTSPPSGTLWLHGLKARFSAGGSLGEIIDLRWAPHTGQVSDLRFHPC